MGRLPRGQQPPVASGSAVGDRVGRHLGAALASHGTGASESRPASHRRPAIGRGSRDRVVDSSARPALDPSAQRPALTSERADASVQARPVDEGTRGHRGVDNARAGGGAADEAVGGGVITHAGAASWAAPPPPRRESLAADPAKAGRRHTWRWGGDQRVTGGDRRVTGGGHGGAVVCTLPLRVPIMALALSL